MCFEHANTCQIVAKKVACQHFSTPCQKVCKNVSKSTKYDKQYIKKVSESFKTYQPCEKCTEPMRYNNFACQSVSNRVKHSFRVKQCHSFETHCVFQGRVGKTTHMLAMRR